MPVQTLTPDDLKPIFERIQELEHKIELLEKKQAAIPVFCRFKDVRKFIVNINFSTLNKWVIEGHVKRTRREGVTIYDRDSILDFLNSDKAPLWSRGKKID